MSSRFLTLGLVLGAVAGACFATHRNAQRRLSSAHTPHAAPVEVQTWEGEGGAVPIGGSRIAKEVDPVPLPTANGTSVMGAPN
ncbi:hypothetical protein BH09PSE5_BH09PSE5_19190 [soil metagenome]